MQGVVSAFRPMTTSCTSGSQLPLMMIHRFFTKSQRGWCRVITTISELGTQG